MDASDLIDDYLAGSLSEEARAAFEQRLAQDPALRAEVELQRRIDEAATARRDDDRYRELIRRAEEKYRTPQSIEVRRSTKKWWLLAAIILLTIAVAILQPWRESPRQLAARYGAINQVADYLPPDYLSSRTTVDSVDPATDPADPIRYARSLVLLDTIPEVALQAYRQIPDSLLNDSLRFETALLYLADRRPAAALERLDSLGPDFRDDRLWYAALAHLQQGDRDAARQLIGDLLRLEDFTPYRRDAQRLWVDLGGETE